MAAELRSTTREKWKLRGIDVGFDLFFRKIR